MSKPIPALRALAVAAAGATAFTLSTAAVAQETTPAPTERIEVTGSLIKRVEAETSLPIEVITREQINRMGDTNAEQILLNLTSTSGVGGFTGTQSVGLAVYSQSGASLRALGAQRTLTLVNGRRMADFPGGATSAAATSFDLNAIPASAIERIEVLQDGASSIYGSEAMAGVINVILRQNYKGLEVSGYLGTPTREGGGRIEKFGVVGGWGDYDADRFNVFLSVDGEHDQPLYGPDRSFATKSWDPVLGDFSATPSGMVQGTWTPGLPAGNQTTHGTPGYGTPYDNNQCGLLGVGQAVDPNFAGIPRLPFPNVGTCRYNPESNFGVLIPTTDRFDVLSRLNFKLNDSTKLFGEFLYAHTHTDILQQPSPYNISFLTTDLKFTNPAINPAGPNHVDASLLIYPSNFYFQQVLVPFAAANPSTPLAGQINASVATAAICAANPKDPNCRPLAVSLRAYDAGRRDQDDSADQYRLSLGAQGTALDFDYDVTAATNKSRIQNSTSSGFQQQFAFVKLLNGLQGGTADTAWNPFGPNAPNVAAAMKATNYNGLAFKGNVTTNGIDAKASRPVFDLPGGPLEAAAGITARRETISIDSPPVFATGDISGYGAPILSFSNGRSVYAGYAELDAPIIKMVELDLAVRSDKYTGSGTVTSPKASLRLQPDSRLLLRGSIGKGFRAPSLGEAYAPAFLGTSGNLTDWLTGTRTQFPQLFGGNANLKPEKSTQDSFGFVLEPIKNVSLAVDYFAVRISNSIGALSPGDVLALEQAGSPIVAGLVQRAPNGTILQINTTNVNLGNLAASGVEINARWRSPDFSIGRVTASMTGTYMDRYDQTLPDGTVEGSVAATTTNPTSFTNLTAVGNNGGVIMRWKHNLDIVLDKNDWTVSATQHFQSGYEDFPDNFGNPHLVGAFSTWDAQIAQQMTKALRWSIGVKNLFDRNPPEAAYGLYFQTGYDPTYYDARARFLYGTLSYKFF